MKYSSRGKKWPLTRPQPAAAPSPAQPSRSSGADDHHAGVGVVGDLVRHAAEQKPARPGHAAVADHDEVGIHVVGDVEDRVGRVALARVHLDLDAGLLDLLPRVAQGLVDLLVRVDRPLHVLGRLLAVVAELLLGDGLVGADEMERRTDRLGELDRLAHGLAGRLGAVGAYYDRAVHAPPLTRAADGEDHMGRARDEGSAPPASQWLCDRLAALLALHADRHRDLRADLRGHRRHQAVATRGGAPTRRPAAGRRMALWRERGAPTSPGWLSRRLALRDFSSA